MKIIIITYKSGLEECILFNLDALQYMEAVISDIEDMRIYTVEKIAHESTEKIIELSSK